MTSTDQANSGILCIVMPGARMLKIVVMKLIAPRIEEAPARCSDRMTKSIAGPGVPAVDENGGYSTQPPPNPCMPGEPSTNIEVSSSRNEAGSSQNEILFMRGNAMSGAPIISGTNQLPNPPISAGMTRKKIMMTPWAVMNTLYMFLAASIEPSPARMAEIVGKIWMPGYISSMRMAPERALPIRPAITAKIR